MASRKRDMPSGGRTGQFDHNNRFNGRTEEGQMQNYLNQNNQVQPTRQNSYPLPSFNPAIPPPSLTSSGYSSQNITTTLMPQSKYSQPHPTSNYQKVAGGDQISSGTNTTFYPKHNPAFQHGKNVPYQSYQPRTAVSYNNTLFQPDRNNTFQSNNEPQFTPQNNQHRNILNTASTIPSQSRNTLVFKPVAYNQYQTGNNPPFHLGNNQPFYGGNNGSGNIPFLPAHNVPFIARNHPPQPVIQVASQEELDRSWVNQWLKQHQIQKTVTEPMITTMKIGEAHSLFQKCLHLKEQLKTGHDELIKNIELPEKEWNECFTKINTIKNELQSIQRIFSDRTVLENLKDKIDKRRKKKNWLKNRMKRRYLEKNEDMKRKVRLHEQIDKWQKEKIEKDLAARKEALLKREAGGVLGEVRRKQTDGRKLLELLKSIKKLREIRKSEGEKKGVYPKTTPENESKFTEKSKFVENFITKRIKSYEDEEKALRVMLVEEEEEREKKEEQERMEQKALLNLSKEPDPLADFRRYYEQAEQGIDYLVQIRREWDAYVVPSHVFGASRIPDGEVLPSPPSNDIWSSVLVDSDNNKNKDELSTG